MPSLPRPFCALTLILILILLFPAFHAVADRPRVVDHNTQATVRWNPPAAQHAAAKHAAASISAKSSQLIQQTSIQTGQEVIPLPDHDAVETLDAAAPSESVLDDSYIVSNEAQWSMDEAAAVTTACCSNDRFWIRAEYLYWQTRGMFAPPLVTTSSAGTDEEDAGVLGMQTTSVVYGNQRIVDDGNSGGRLQLGGWLDDCRCHGLEFIYTALGDQSDSFTASNTQFPLLARPFFNVESGQQDSRLLGFPGVVSGNVAIGSTTDYQVFELLIRRAISHSWRAPTSIVYGYRAAELKDSLLISDLSTSLAGATTGATVAITDDFRSRNRFNGFEMGLLSDFRLSPCWQLSLVGKVAFGETESVTTINGQTLATNATGDVTTTSGGLLTQASNMGRFESNSHGVLQDFSIRFHRYLDCGITMNFGYGIHRWLDVARSSEQIDLSVNPTQIPPGNLVGAARPQFLDTKSDFIAQGISAGLEYYW